MGAAAASCPPHTLCILHYHFIAHVGWWWFLLSCKGYIGGALRAAHSSFSVSSDAALRRYCSVSQIKLMLFNTISHGFWQLLAYWRISFIVCMSCKGDDDISGSVWNCNGRQKCTGQQQSTVEVKRLGVGKGCCSVSIELNSASESVMEHFWPVKESCCCCYSNLPCPYLFLCSRGLTLLTLKQAACQQLQVTVCVHILCHSIWRVYWKGSQWG